MLPLHEAHITPEEARQKLLYLHRKLWLEQYKVNFIVEDLRPEMLLKAELRAFWEGRVREVHGFSEPIKQALEWVWENVIKPAVEAFWENIIKPAVQGMLDALGWIADKANELIESMLKEATKAGKWLYKRIQDAVGFIKDAVQDAWDDIVKTVSGGLEAITRGLEALPQAIASAFQSAVSYVATLVTDVGKQITKYFSWLNKKVIQPIVRGISWLFDWIADVARTFFESMVSLLQGISQRIQRGEWTAALEIIVPVTSAGLSLNAILSIAGTKVLGTGIEVGELSRFLNRLLSPEVVTGALVGAVMYASLTQPLRQAFNKQFRTIIPPQNDLETMYRRGLITEDEYRDYLARMGYSDKLINGYLDMAQVIPGISDLIRFAVREAYPVETTEEQWAELEKWAAKQGLSKYWVDRYVIAHWELPAFSQLREAFWRGIIDAEDFRKFIVKHDYRPDPWPGHKKSDLDIMYELSYKLPGRIDARWMLRWGVIGREELKQLTMMEGIHPEWVDRVVEGEIRNMLIDERTRLLTQLRAQYINGIITREELEQELQKAMYSAIEISWILWACDLERERKAYEETLVKPREATRADFARAYRLGIISEEQFKAALKTLRYPDPVIDLIIRIENELKAIEAERERQRREAELERQTKEMTRSDLSRAFKLGLIDEATYITRLMELGYPEAEAKQIVEIDKKRIALELTREEVRKREQETREMARLTTDEKNSVRRALKSLYTKGMLPEEAFRAKLKELGFTPEEIQLTIDAANYELMEELMEDRIQAAIYEYRYGKISLEQLAQRLSQSGLKPDFIQSILDVERARTKLPVQSTPEEEVRAFGSGVVIRRYREGLITDAELEHELRLLGYGPAEIERYKIYAALERDYNFAMELISALRSALRAGKISETHFLEVMQEYGIGRMIALMYLNLEKLRKGIGLGEEAE